jgi:crossover junction endodeoxyribonuclease RuvC
VLSFLGTDLSLNSSGLVILDENATIQTQFLLTPPKGCVGIERLFFLEQSLIEFLNKNNIIYCCIESPALGTEQGRLFDLGEWAGLFKLQLFKKGIQFILVAPSQLKKYASGSGSSKKELLILDVYKNFGVELREHDINDAYILARICHDFYSYIDLDLSSKDISFNLKKYQIEVLSSLRKKYLNVKSLL